VSLARFWKFTLNLIETIRDEELAVFRQNVASEGLFVLLMERVEICFVFQIFYDLGLYAGKSKEFLYTHLFELSAGFLIII
jgi:hypothetical protein